MTGNPISEIVSNTDGEVVSNTDSHGLMSVYKDDQVLSYRIGHESQIAFPSNSGRTSLPVSINPLPP